MRRAGIREAGGGRQGAMNVASMIYVRIRQFIAAACKINNVAYVAALRNSCAERSQHHSAVERGRFPVHTATLMPVYPCQLPDRRRALSNLLPRFTEILDQSNSKL